VEASGVGSLILIFDVHFTYYRYYIKAASIFYKNDIAEKVVRRPDRQRLPAVECPRSRSLQAWRVSPRNLA